MTQDDDMVERVAWAIGAAADLSVGGDIILMECARAALEAMRDPPESMADHPSYQDGLWSRANIEAFVDAALSQHRGRG